MKGLEKLRNELPKKSMLNSLQSGSLKGGGDKRKDRPSSGPTEVITETVSTVFITPGL